MVRCGRCRQEFDFPKLEDLLPVPELQKPKDELPPMAIVCPRCNEVVRMTNPNKQHWAAGNETWNEWKERFDKNFKRTNTGSREDVLAVVRDLTEWSQRQRPTKAEESLLRRAKSLLDAPDMWMDSH
jgi:hypothetical protein